MPTKKAHVRQSRKKPKKRVPGACVRDPIPVEPVRRIVLTAMQERGLSLADVAALASDSDRARKETTWVQRRLGLKPEANSYHNGKAYTSQPHGFINRDIAVRLVRAVGEFPCDVVDENGEALL